MEERLQKIIAAAGICSRRAAEDLLIAGKVRVNGKIARIGDKADLSKDLIECDGIQITGKDEHVYLMLNKPIGYLSSLSDPHCKKLASDLVKGCGVRVNPVGRLDRESEGLLLFTNDGELIQRLTHPSFQVNKTYFVTVTGDISDAAIHLSSVCEVDGKPIAHAEVLTLKSNRKEALLSVTIHEGRNRQIRKMCASCGLEVKRLQRVTEHDLTLGNLRPGEWRYLTVDEINRLKKEGNADV